MINSFKKNAKLVLSNGCIFPGFSFGISGTAVDEVVFASGAKLGDTVRIVSNGVNYFVTAQVHDAAHVTIS